MILKGVSIRVEPGEIVSIIGPNGAGKSTFFKIVAGLLSAREGRVLFDGAEIHRLDARAVAERGIAFVPQELNVSPSMSIQENLEMGGFMPLITIYIFLALTAGGTGNNLGAVIGAFVVLAILESTRFLADLAPGLGGAQVAAVREIAIASALILVLRFRPTGLLPERLPRHAGTAGAIPDAMKPST